MYRQRHRAAREAVPRAKRPRPPRSLTTIEQGKVLAVLHEPRFVDQTPQEVYAILLDENIYLCSIRTMYRLLNQHDEAKERRDVIRHTKYQKPELLATGPNQVWSWDITKLLGPIKWTYFYLYVIMGNRSPPLCSESGWNWEVVLIGAGTGQYIGDV